MQAPRWQQTFLHRQVRAVRISWDKVRIFVFRGIETLSAFICRNWSMLTRLGSRRVVVVCRLWMIRGQNRRLMRRLILLLVLTKIVVRNCSLGRRPTVRLFLMTPLSFGASCLLILRVDPIRTRGVYPPRATSSTWPPPSSTPTGPDCISDHSGSPTRTSSFPRLSRSPPPSRPTSSICSDATSRLRSLPRTTSGTGRWHPQPGHHLHRISVVRGHGFEHRPEPDPPLLHPTPRLNCLPFLGHRN